MISSAIPQHPLVAYLNAHSAASRLLAYLAAFLLAVCYLTIWSVAVVNDLDFSMAAFLAGLVAAGVAIRLVWERADYLVASFLLLSLGTWGTVAGWTASDHAVTANASIERDYDNLLPRLVGRSATFEAAEQVSALLESQPNTLSLTLDERMLTITADHDMAFVSPSGMPRIVGSSSEVVTVRAGNFDLFASFMARKGYRLTRDRPASGGKAFVSLVALAGG